MSVAEEIAALVKKPSVQCGACRAIAALEDEVRAQFLQVLADRSGPPLTACAAWLSNKSGMPVRDHVLGHHARQGHT